MAAGELEELVVSVVGGLAGGVGIRKEPYELEKQLSQVGQLVGKLEQHLVELLLAFL